ncbi:MAG: cobalamin B12-binding domain-containing protein [Candidatus Helarchaeota archaeon]
MNTEQIKKELHAAIVSGNHIEAAKLAKKIIEQKIEINSILQESMVPAMDEVGELFEKKEYFIPELLISARAMESALKILKPHIKIDEEIIAGTIIVGTVQGDIHDIGKNLVKYFLEGAGFKVIDLGKEVTVEKFIAAIKKEKADILAMSALITTTMPYFKKVIEGLKTANLRDKVKVMVGGAPVTPEFAKRVGADAYGEDSAKAVRIARNLITELKEKS